MGTTPLELPATLTPDEVRRLLWLEQLDSVYQMIVAGELAARRYSSASSASTRPPANDRPTKGERHGAGPPGSAPLTTSVRA